MSTRPTLYCSFCGKGQHEVHKLIAGPTVFICDECVLLAVDIIFCETYHFTPIVYPSDYVHMLGTDQIDVIPAKRWYDRSGKKNDILSVRFREA